LLKRGKTKIVMINNGTNNNSPFKGSPFQGSLTQTEKVLKTKTENTGSSCWTNSILDFFKQILDGEIPIPRSKHYSDPTKFDKIEVIMIQYEYPELIVEIFGCQVYVYHF
jgi:hypothetical protein